MTKQRVIVLALVSIVLLLAAMYRWGPSSVPRGQEPLVALSSTNFSDFENAFDRASEAPRLVLLLSPT
jgi:hypothetical protein